MKLVASLGLASLFAPPFGSSATLYCNHAPRKNGGSCLKCRVHIEPLHRPTAALLMTGGILEVLLVSAEDIKHRNFFGKPKYYVIIQCGTQIHRSKISSGKDEKTYWNGKFMFEFPHSEWKNSTHLKLRIMDKELFRGGGLIGETIIHLGGIITEGYTKGFMELTPAPYNVVLEDDTYKGMIKVGLKFIAKKEERRETGEYEVKEELIQARDYEVKEELIQTREYELKEVKEEYRETREFEAEKEQRHSIYKTITSVWKFSWWRLFFNKRTSYRNEKKQI